MLIFCIYRIKALTEMNKGIEWSLKNHGSRKILGESRNLELAKKYARLGISNFEIESPSLTSQAKVLISLNRHKTVATTTAKQRAPECQTSIVIVSRWDF